MKPHELLKPRYKCIADYPGSHLKIGQVVDEDYAKRDYDAKNEFEKYPAIFKKLEWYEERKESDMPEYLRSRAGNFIVKVNRYIDKGVTVAINNEFFNRVDITLLNLYLPAIESEYLNQKSK